MLFSNTEFTEYTKCFRFFRVLIKNFAFERMSKD